MLNSLLLTLATIAALIAYRCAAVHAARKHRTELRSWPMLDMIINRSIVLDLIPAVLLQWVLEIAWVLMVGPLPPHMGAARGTARGGALGDRR